MDQLSTLFQLVMESLKSTLTTPHFGSEYGLLCTELSIQSHRVRLWGNLVGLNIDCTNGLRSAPLDQSGLYTTVTEVLESVAFILSEIEELRQRYQWKQFPADKMRLGTPDSLCPPHAHRLSLLGSSFRHRAQTNQKQKSILALIKWTIRDQRRFEEKLKRLKCLIDGLEVVARAFGVSTHPQFQTQESTNQHEHPPPYSAAVASLPSPILYMGAFGSEDASTSGVVAIEHREGSGGSCGSPNPRNESNVPIPVDHSGSVGANARSSATYNLIVDLFHQHAALKRYLVSIGGRVSRPVATAQEKLTQLSTNSFNDLFADIYDELLRRQQWKPPYLQHLHPVTQVHPNRNAARLKLSNLTSFRFGDLVRDTVPEFERRYPHIQGLVSRIESPALQSWILSATHRRYSTRRWGHVPPHAEDAPPPLLRYRAPHRAAFNTYANLDGPVSTYQELRDISA